MTTIKTNKATMVAVENKSNCMKKIEDYLHLCIGWRCSTGSWFPAEPAERIIGYVDNWDRMICGVYFYYPNFKDCVKSEIHELPIESVKPHGRRLSSMTEEEKKEFLNIRFTLPEEKINELLKEGRIDLVEMPTSCFHYLLSKHFDLFGLIDDNLAIEKQ